MDIAEARELVARSCRVMGRLDLSHAALGHVSCRLGGDRFLIKGKGPDEVGLRYTSPGDIIEVDFDAQAVDAPAGLQPPSESYIHIALYQDRPDVDSVVHVHPPEAVLLTACGRELVPFYGAYGPGARLAAEGVPVFPRSIRISTPELGKDLSGFMGGKRCCVMYGHGITAVGESVEEASVTAIDLAELLSMTYRAYLVGEPRRLPDEDLREIAKPLDPDRTAGSAGGRAGALASWRYYEALTAER